jgi:hypothetical protein
MILEPQRTMCAKCGRVIEPAETRQVAFDGDGCPSCGSPFSREGRQLKRSAWTLSAPMPVPEKLDCMVDLCKQPALRRRFNFNGLRALCIIIRRVIDASAYSV